MLMAGDPPEETILNGKRMIVVMLPLSLLLAACSVLGLDVQVEGGVERRGGIDPAGDQPVVEPGLDAEPGSEEAANPRPQSGGGGGEGYQDGFCCGFPDAGNGPYELLMTTIVGVDPAAGTVTLAEASQAGAVVAVDEHTSLRLIDITPDGAPITIDDLQPGMSVQAEVLVENGDPPPLQAIWVHPEEDLPFPTDQPYEVRDAPIQAVDTVNNRFVQEPYGEIILYDENTTFIYDDGSFNGVEAGPADLAVGRSAHVVLLQGPDGPVMEFPPENPLTAVQIILYDR